jgi:hypothetical protein
VPDDRGRKLVAGKRDRHPPSYPANRDALTVAVTEPPAVKKPALQGRRRLRCWGR